MNISQQHALVLSFPMQGHITPLLQLAHRLSSPDFLITFVISDYTNSRSPRSPAAHKSSQNPSPLHHLNQYLRIVAVPDDLPPHFPRDQGFAQQHQAMDGMRIPVQQLLARYNSPQTLPSQLPPISCIISDVFVTWAFDVASSFQLPLVSFYTANATSCSVLYHARELLAKGILPFKDDDHNLVTCIPGVLPLRHYEFPPSLQSPDASAYRFQFTLKMFEHVHESAGLVLNTVYELEPKVIDALREKFPVFPIGPLLLPTSGDEALPTEPELTFWEEEDECLTWLDTQAPASVLYVSFGSIATYSDKQFKELAMGLARSKQPFLWVVRRDSIPGSLRRALPSGFMEETKGRGLIVSWAPQLRVLAHASVGGFLSHCGWNSILESISIGGIPILCWPDIADQMVNRRLLVDDWKIGLEFKEGEEERLLGSEEIERVVKILLQSEEGNKMRKKAGQVKSVMQSVVRKGGSSFSNVEAFMECLKWKKEDTNELQKTTNNLAVNCLSTNVQSPFISGTV